MTPRALELFETQELIDELMIRKTFLGVVVQAKEELRIPWPQGEKAFRIHYNENLDRGEVRRLLATVSDRLEYLA